MITTRITMRHHTQFSLKITQSRRAMRTKTGMVFYTFVVTQIEEEPNEEKHRGPPRRDNRERPPYQERPKKVYNDNPNTNFKLYY